MNMKKGKGGKNAYSDNLNKATRSTGRTHDKKVNKNNYFAPYLTPPEVARGLNSGNLIEGVLRINQKAYEDAFICSPDTGQQDIYIKGVQARCRALNGDIVIVQLSHPGEWKVNHDIVHDYLEIKGTDEERAALMVNCIVNVKEENVKQTSMSKAQGTTCVTDETKEVTASNSSSCIEGGVTLDDLKNQIEAEICGYVEDGASRMEKTDITNDEHSDLIKLAKDPLDDIPVATVSDYESDHSIEEVDEELSAQIPKLGNLKINNGELIIDISSNTEKDSDSDVIVESTVDLVLGEPLASSPKKSRRGKRGKKKSSVSLSTNSTCNTTMDSNTSSGSRKRVAIKPLVEYNIFSVLKHPVWEKYGMVQKTGKVVAIREMKHTRVAAGTIKLMSDKNPKFFLFSPTDSRVPRMKIPMEEAPQNFMNRPEDFAGMMFVARILKWDMVNSALGTIERSLGHSSDIGVRTEGLLLENNIDYSDFSNEVLLDLPSNHENWSIPPQEIKRRRDFRNECVFTIDPLTARDLDDALSVTLQEDGLYRVGVHIADVSYFVKEGTSLDKVASERTTSTYLVQKVIPMLPRPLCENLCSLNPDEDRLTFTVEWTMNSKAQIVSEWFGRSVIRSCTKLAYEHAQSMIDLPGQSIDTLPTISEPYTSIDISNKVNMLQMLAVQLRNKREQSGALRLDQPKLCFSLNHETGLPDGFKLHEHRHSNKLIEEFMLLANMAVARKIYTTFTDVSVLRRHPPPKADMMEKVVEQLGGLGVDIDSSSAGGLASSIAKIKESDRTDMEKQAQLACVTSMCSKPMELARYFCTGLYQIEDFHHFALNVPLYTHFTSPIRRYPDILVHRLLDAAIISRRPPWDPVEVQQVAEHCNDKRLAAKKVSEASSELFLGLFIAECGPLTQPGAVLQVMDHSMDVLILNMGVVKRVYIDRLGVSNHNFRRVLGINYMDLWWSDGSKLTLTTLSQVNLSLAKGDRDFEFIAVIDKPEKEKDDGIITLD